MFEEEAKEFKKQIQQEYLDLGKNGAYPPLWERIGELWEKGAEFGYNKAMDEMQEQGLALQSDMDKTIEQNIALKKELEKANEWHYVKDGLPKIRKYVLVYTTLKNLYLARLIKANYFINKNGGLVQTSSVIAWKEIVLPKESE